jgi:hypothetical protein
MTTVFPIILILLDLAASIVYFCCGDWARVLYWFAAALITLSTLWI